MPANWISPKYLDGTEIEKIRKNFKKAKPYPNLALHGFFNESKLLGLKKAVLAEKFEKQDKDLFSFSQTKELSRSKNKTIREFFNFLSSNGFLGLMELLTGETLENADLHAHLYAQGDYLLFHDDVVGRRKIAYITYLSGLKPVDGGSLRLYDLKKPLHPAKKITPMFNCFACFKVSGKSLHDVEEIKTNKKRLSVGGWLNGD
jgi:Rps23 Pro-64 3,4-dihydroxylase Tpa1-like proline 4-hydroxylase